MAQQINPSNPLQVRSLEKWKRVFQDELDMAENEEFLVLKTSMCGWWYAINKKQEDGLIPYMYLEILGDYVDYTEITQHEFSHIERTVLAWDIHNVCKLVFQDQKSTTQEQNILLHSLRNLYIMCQKQDCRYTFLSKGGLDRLHNILQNTYDIAIRTFCLRALILLAPSIESRRFPAQSNLTEGILGVMKEYMDMPSFVCICTDALSNVAFQNERQRMLASQTNAVEMLLYAMERHTTVFKVQLQASRSLANMASDPKIQRQIDDKGVQTLLNSLNAIFTQDAVTGAIADQYGQDRQHQNQQQKQQQQQNRGALFDAKKGQFAQQMLVILSYLITDPRKAQTFGRLGGWQCLKTIMNSIGVWDEAVRATIVGMLNGMSQHPAIARRFFDNNYEGYDILFDMVLDAEPYSLYFYQIFSIICFISCKCDKQMLPTVIIHAFQQKQLARLMNDALQQRDNERLMDTVPTICALTARTKHQEAQDYIFKSMVPMHLLKIIGTQPGAPNDQFLNYSLITIYNLTDDEERVDPFIQNGAIEAIAMNDFYRDPMKEENITQNGIAALVNICNKTRRKLLPQQQQAIQEMIQTCFQTHPKLKPLIQKLDVALKRAQQAGGGKKKQRNARNKKGYKPNKNQQQQQGGVQGAYDPQSGSYQGQQNAQKPHNYQENQNQQQQQQQQGNYQGPVQSGLVEKPYHDDSKQQYGSQQNFGGPQQQQQNYGGPSQQNFGGPPQQQYGSQQNVGGPQQQQQNYGGPPQQQNYGNQNPYGSQQNFGGGPPQQQNYGGPSQQNFGGPPQQQQQQQNYGAPPQRQQNPYPSQQNFGNIPPQNNQAQNQGQNQGNQGKQGGLYGKDKWETDSEENPNDSSSEDEWEKQKNAKINAASQVGFKGNNPQPMAQQYGAPHNPQQQPQQQGNSAWNDDSSDEEQGNDQGWGPPQNQQQQQQQQQYGMNNQQQPMSKQSIAKWNDQQVQPRDYIGYNQNQGDGGQQMQQEAPQQQQQEAPKAKKKKKKGKFKLFGK